MHIRPYEERDKAACLAIFDSNSPKYFAPHERDEFIEFLNEPECTYYVIEDGTDISGCGGFWVSDDGSRAVMCWGMVANDKHGTGLGKWLLLHRWQLICAIATGAMLEINTSQHTYGFFKKLGLNVVAIVKDGYGAGIDRYEMRLKLDATECERISVLYEASTKTV